VDGRTSTARRRWEWGPSYHRAAREPLGYRPYDVGMERCAGLPQTGRPVRPPRPPAGPRAPPAGRSPARSRRWLCAFFLWTFPLRSKVS